MPERIDASNHALSPYDPIACFHPTAKELETLARDHMEAWYSYEWGHRVGGCVGLSDIGWQDWASERIANIETVLGKERVSKILKPIRGHWDGLFNEVEDLCKVRGVSDAPALDIDDPLWRNIAARAGVVLVLPSLPREKEAKSVE